MADEIKEFKAGIIDEKLDLHIDECVTRLKLKAAKRGWFWRLRERGLFWRFRNW
jgi:hypothetical protein